MAIGGVTLNIDHLRTFVTVARTRHFSRAAKILHLSQPAISHHIHSLEDYFKAPLFDRRPREILLTPFSERLLPRVEKLLELYQELESFSLREDKPPLSIAASNTIGEYMLADLIRSFLSQERLPYDRLNARVMTTKEALDSVEKGECDIALIEGKVSDPVFTYAVFAQDEMLPVAASTYPLTQNATLVELAEATWVMREEGCMMRLHAESFIQTIGLPVERLHILSMNNNHLLKQSIKNGLGVGLLPRRTIEKELRDGSLIRIHTQPSSHDRPLHIVRRNGPFPSFIAHLFWDFVAGSRQSGD
ncbi:LysR family transcriptional regulator [Thermicanus aegyptius]|uniref:LysR family transcriptional regulator n=1 Tax=Thermicanus aegyptius TaxID=94009 RepID=UPI00034C3FDB|nr:LysR family transcriptional regulator [Thermicanus aegyptius]